MIRRRCEHKPCGREFVARCSNQKFCSVWHRRAAWLARRAGNPSRFDSGRFDDCSAPSLSPAGLERLTEALSGA